MMKAENTNTDTAKTPTDDAFDFELRRALLEDAATPDVRKAFRRFVRRNTVRSRRHGRLWATVSVAAAACAVALLAFSFWHSADDAARSELAQLGNVVYEAQAERQWITLQLDGETMDCDGATFTQKGIKVTSDNEIVVFDQPDTKQETATLTVPSGRTAKVTLDDGTVIQLNAGSSLTFPNRFGKDGERRVKLEGEASFEVAHDESRPFVVDCGKCQTRVLGTVFNIRCYKEETPRVTLVSGRISVASDGSETILEPGQTVAVADDNTQSVSEADIEVVTGWQTGQFYYDGQTLREIMTEVGRWYNLNVVFATNTHLNDQLHLNVERTVPLAEVVRQIQMICDVTIQAKGNVLIVK